MQKWRNHPQFSNCWGWQTIVQWRYIFHNRCKLLLKELAQKILVTDPVLSDSSEQSSSQSLVHNRYLVLKTYHVKGYPFTRKRQICNRELKINLGIFVKWISVGLVLFSAVTFFWVINSVNTQMYCKWNTQYSGCRHIVLCEE